MFGPGARDRQADLPAGKDVLWEVHWLISREDLHFSSLCLSVFPVFANHMKYLEANSPLFHDSISHFSMIYIPRSELEN